MLLRKLRHGLLWLLLIPYIALLWVPAYARATPALWGFPFFYWYLFLWVILTAGITGLVYRCRR